MIRSCRKHRNLLPRNLWLATDTDIYTLQLSSSDDVFSHGIKLLLQKWQANSLINISQNTLLIDRLKNCLIC